MINQKVEIVVDATLVEPVRIVKCLVIIWNVFFTPFITLKYSSRNNAILHNHATYPKYSSKFFIRHGPWGGVTGEGVGVSCVLAGQADRERRGILKQEGQCGSSGRFCGWGMWDPSISGKSLFLGLGGSAPSSPLALPC